MELHLLSGKPTWIHLYEPNIDVARTEIFDKKLAKSFDAAGELAMEAGTMTGLVFDSWVEKRLNKALVEQASSTA